MFCIYEVFPCKLSMCMHRHLLTFDNISDAKDVIHLLYKMNYNWTCYEILHTPYKWKMI